MRLKDADSFVYVTELNTKKFKGQLVHFTDAAIDIIDKALLVKDISIEEAYEKLEQGEENIYLLGEMDYMTEEELNILIGEVESSLEDMCEDDLSEELDEVVDIIMKQITMTKCVEYCRKRFAPLKPVMEEFLFNYTEEDLVIGLVEES